MAFVKLLVAPDTFAFALSVFSTFEMLPTCNSPTFKKLLVIVPIEEVDETRLVFTVILTHPISPEATRSKHSMSPLATKSSQTRSPSISNCC